MGDFGECDCCGRRQPLPYESRHGWCYCQDCYDVGCALSASEPCDLPSLAQVRETPLDTDEQLGIPAGPTDAEVAEAIAAIKAVGT